MAEGKFKMNYQDRITNLAEAKEALGQISIMDIEPVVITHMQKRIDTAIGTAFKQFAKSVGYEEKNSQYLALIKKEYAKNLRIEYTSGYVSMNCPEGMYLAHSIIKASSEEEAWREFTKMYDFPKKMMRFIPLGKGVGAIDL